MSECSPDSQRNWMRASSRHRSSTGWIPFVCVLVFLLPSHLWLALTPIGASTPLLLRARPTGLTKVNEVGRQDASQAGGCGADPYAHVSDHCGVQLGCVHVDHGKGRSHSKLAHHHQGCGQIIQVWRGKGKKVRESTNPRYIAIESTVCVCVCARARVCIARNKQSLP